VDARQERLAANEAWFREINEQIESQALKLGSDTHRYDFICECANVDCAERMKMTLAEYEAVRAHPERFAIVPGHDYPEIEDVVARNGIWLVEKRGRGAGAVPGRGA
jgi:hypothetical protein